MPGFFENMPKATIDVMPLVLREAFLKVTPDSAKLMTMFRKGKQRMIDFPDWPDDDLRSIKAPAMIISSDRDVIVPEHSVRMARLIPERPVDNPAGSAWGTDRRVGSRGGQGGCGYRGEVSGGVSGGEVKAKGGGGEGENARW